MSNPQFSDGTGSRRWSEDTPRHLLGPLMVATALITGMFLGRILTKTETRRDIARLEAQLSERQAEIDTLRSDTLRSAALQPPSQQFELDRLRDQHRQLVTQLDELASQLQSQQSLIGRAIQTAETDQQICLDELRQFQQADRPLPAEDVLHFAKRMFETRRRLLDSLAAGREYSAAAAPAAHAPTLPQAADVAGGHLATGEHQFIFAPDDPADQAPVSLSTTATTQSSVRQPMAPSFTYGGNEAHTPLRLEPQPESRQKPNEQGESVGRRESAGQGESAGQRGSARSSGVFFDPPPQQRTGYTYIARRQRTPVAPSRRPRDVFTGRADDGENSLLR